MYSGVLVCFKITGDTHLGLTIAKIKTFTWQWRGGREEEGKVAVLSYQLM